MIHTSHEAAAILGVGPRRVTQMARAAGVGEKRGRDWHFSDADLDVLRARNRKVGRPKKEQSNGN